MTYIYEKKVAGKSYFYLRIAKRVKSRIIVKDVAYLGDDISNLTIQKLEEKCKKYAKEIRISYKKIRKTIESRHFIEKARTLKLKQQVYFSKEQLLDIEACRLHFDEFLKRDYMTKQEVFDSFSNAFAVDSSAIEGNTITLKEAELMLSQNVLPSKKTLREAYEVRNNKDVLTYLFENKMDISKDNIIELHKMLMRDIDERIGFRLHEVRILGSKTHVTPYPYIKYDVEQLLSWYENNKDKLHPLALSSLFHIKFEKIHPFSDGNGRTGRVLSMLILYNSKYPPFSIRKENRKDYLKAFEGQDDLGLKESDPLKIKKMLDFFVEEFVETYWSNFLI